MATPNTLENLLTEQRDVRYFADAAAIMADQALDTLETWDEERRIHTRLLEDLKADAQAVYRSSRDGNPEMTAALVAAGRNHNLRLQRRLEKYIEGMAAEGHTGAEKSKPLSREAGSSSAVGAR